MKVKKFRILSNIIIVFMLMFLITYIGASIYQYVFSYENNDIIYNGNRDSNNVSFMINVYWGTEYIDSMLDIFNKYNVKTTFFVGGQWVEKNINVLDKIIQHGHEIGNHGYFHKDHERLNYEQNYDEINVTHQLIKANYNLDMNLFAPPSGSFNQSTISSCKELGYQTIMWTKDTIDWRDKNVNQIFLRATNNITGGDFILAHPTDCTVKALPLILEYYKINNINATTVSNCLK